MDNCFENQTFGVEIEMYNISRQKAAELVASYFNTEAWDSAEELKYCSWACKDDKDRLWQFRRDRSIRPNRIKYPEVRIVNFSNVCEIVTPILQGVNDLNQFLNIMQLLINNGARSDADMQCSVHVHIGAEGYNVTGLCDLLNLFSSIETDLAENLQIDQYRLLRYCKPLEPELLDKINCIRPKKMNDFYNIWYDGYDEKMTDHYNKSRYHALNMHSLKCHGTVEFRIFEFNTNIDIAQLQAFILFSLWLTKYTKIHKNIKASTVNDLIDQLDCPFEEYKILDDILCKKKSCCKSVPISNDILSNINNYEEEQDIY